MKALSTALRVKGLSRASTAEKARRHMHRAKTPVSPPASMNTTHAVTRQSIAGFTSYRVTSRDARPHTTVLYLYGGGYVSQISAPHWALIARLADAGMQVEVPIYGLAPRYDHNDALPFLTAVYRQLTTEDPSMPVALAGDSAGGGLALLLAQTARDRCLPPPSRLILISPWLDLSLTNPEIPRVERRDPWLSRVALDMAARAWAPDRALTHSSVSPLYGELGGLAPTELHIGTHDMLYPDALLFHDKATAAGSSVELNTCPSGLHIFPLTPTPEGRAATRSIIESLQDV
jgi:acetyl esterase/lipase